MFILARENQQIDHLLMVGFQRPIAINAFLIGQLTKLLIR
jgi:hypothetical protein